MTPSWTADGHVLVFFGAQRTRTSASTRAAPTTPTGSAIPRCETLLTNVELTRAGDKLVGVGDQNDLRFYDAPRPTRAA